MICSYVDLQLCRSLCIDIEKCIQRYRTISICASFKQDRRLLEICADGFWSADIDVSADQCVDMLISCVEMQIEMQLDTWRISHACLMRIAYRSASIYADIGCRSIHRLFCVSLSICIDAQTDLICSTRIDLHSIRLIHRSYRYADRSTYQYVPVSICIYVERRWHSFVLYNR